MADKCVGFEARAPAKDQRISSVGHPVAVESSQVVPVVHQQETSPSGRNGSVRVDALCHSRQRKPGGRLLRTRRQYHASHCISPSDRSFAVVFSLCRSPISNTQAGVVANSDYTSERFHWVPACIWIAMQGVTLRQTLLAFLLH